MIKSFISFLASTFAKLAAVKSCQENLLAVMYFHPRICQTLKLKT